MVPLPVGDQQKYNLGGATGKGFVPGKSGNPSGRPKGAVSLKEELSRALNECEGRERKRFIQSVIEHANNGNAAYAALLWDRVEGKVTQPLDIRVNGVEVDAINPEALPQVASELGITQGEIDAIGDGLGVAMLGTGGDDDDA
jgi:Family of unknown function (DUF5681)